MIRCQDERFGCEGIGGVLFPGVNAVGEEGNNHERE
jgi:hypothetical protein